MKQYYEYLKDLYNAENYICDESNNEYYNYFENIESRKKALIQISKYGCIDIDKLYSLDEFKNYIPYMQACVEAPIPDLIQKLRIIFNIVNDKLGFNYTELEIIICAIILKNHCYNNKHIKEGTRLLSPFNDNTPFFSINDIKNATKLDDSKIRKFIKIFSVNILDLNEFNIYKIIETEHGYILLFVEKFIYYAFTYLENYIIENNMLCRNDYYSQRGLAFEIYIKSMFESYFQDAKYYTNIKYIYNNKKMEIDLLIDLGDYYIVVEDKSTNYLDYKNVRSDEEFNKLTLKAYNDGMKSLNTVYEFMTNNETLKFENLELKSKKIYTLLITLRKTYFASGKIQKIYFDNEVKHLSPIYHITDISDILLLINNSPIESLQKDFSNYLERRYEIIEKYKNVTADIDEIDLFGMITTPECYEQIKFYMGKFIDLEIDLNVINKNGQYRKSLNNELNNRYLSFILLNYFKEFLGIKK